MSVSHPDRSTQNSVTRILERLAKGDPGAHEALVPLILGDLRKLAHHYIRNERIGHTLQPTALVNEAYLRIAGMRGMNWESRAHFIAVAATLMRRILVDYARKRRVRPEGNSTEPISVDVRGGLDAGQAAEIVAVDRALEMLAELDARQARIVEMRFFGGLSIDEIASVLQLSDRTVKRDWALAKIWLRDQLGEA